jgi:hypothetical protein
MTFMLVGAAIMFIGVLLGASITVTGRPTKEEQ